MSIKHYLVQTSHSIDQRTVCQFWQKKNQGNNTHSVISPQKTDIIPIINLHKIRPCSPLMIRQTLNNIMTSWPTRRQHSAFGFRPNQITCNLAKPQTDNHAAISRYQLEKLILCGDLQITDVRRKSVA